MSSWRESATSRRNREYLGKGKNAKSTTCSDLAQTTTLRCGIHRTGLGAHYALYVPVFISFCPFHDAINLLVEGVNRSTVQYLIIIFKKNNQAPLPQCAGSDFSCPPTFGSRRLESISELRNITRAIPMSSSVSVYTWTDDDILACAVAL